MIAERADMGGPYCLFEGTSIEKGAMGAAAAPPGGSKVTVYLKGGPFSSDPTGGTALGFDVDGERLTL